MDLILLEKVTNLGTLGDKVSVKPGYGRNFLIPQGKAVPANAANVAAFEARRAELEARQAEQLASATARAEKMADLTLIIARKVGGEGKLFGSVSVSDIAEAAVEQGIELSRQEVRLPEGPLRQIGEYQVTLQLHSDVDVEIKVHVVAEE